MAEFVAVAVLFYVLGLLTKVAWISDKIALHPDPAEIDA